MIVKADIGGWIAVPTGDFRGVSFDFQREVRTAPDGSTEVLFTLRPLTDDQVAEILAEELRLYGPASDCDDLDAKISARKAKEAARAAKRGDASAPTLRVVP